MVGACLHEGVEERAAVFALGGPDVEHRLAASAVALFMPIIPLIVPIIMPILVIVGSIFATPGLRVV